MAIWPCGNVTVNDKDGGSHAPATCDGNSEEKLQKSRNVRDRIEHQIEDWLAVVSDTPTTRG